MSEKDAPTSNRQPPTRWSREIKAILRKEIASGIEMLLSTYKTATEVELRSAIAGIDARVGVVKSFTRAAPNLADAQLYLDELLK